MRTIIQVLFFGALACWLVFSVASALRSGVANTRNVLRRRSKSPVMYWFAVIVQAALALLFFYGVIHVLRE